MNKASFLFLLHTTSLIRMMFMLHKLASVYQNTFFFVFLVSIMWISSICILKFFCPCCIILFVCFFFPAFFIMCFCMSACMFLPALSHPSNVLNPSPLPCQSHWQIFYLSCLWRSLSFLYSFIPFYPSFLPFFSHKCWTSTVRFNTCFSVNGFKEVMNFAY